MNIVQFWIVDTIVKHKTSRPIRLGMDEEEMLPEDILISDDEYHADDPFFHDQGSEENDATSVASIKIQHKSATQAQLHRTLSQASAVSEDSLYELRTSNTQH